jgi:hypothetical protein
MKSILTKEDFKKRLKELTRTGNSIMGTPLAVLLMFDFSDKKFYGTIDELNFNLTDNSVFSFSGHIIKGHFKDGELGTDVSFTVKPITFSYYWIRIFPLIGLLAINAVFLYFKFYVISVILIPNLFIGVMLVFLIYNERQKRKKLEGLFIKQFLLE